MSKRERTLYFYNIDIQINQLQFYGMLQNFGPVQEKSFKHSKGGGWFSKIIMKQKATRDAIYDNRNDLELGGQVVVFKEPYCIECYRQKRPNHLFYTPCLQFVPSSSTFGRKAFTDLNQTQVSEEQQKETQPQQQNSQKQQAQANQYPSFAKPQKEQNKDCEDYQSTIASLAIYYLQGERLIKKTFTLGDTYLKDLMRVEIIKQNENDKSIKKATKIYDGSDQNVKYKADYNNIIDMMNKVQITKKNSTKQNQQQHKEQQQTVKKCYNNPFSTSKQPSQQKTQKKKPGKKPQDQQIMFQDQKETVPNKYASEKSKFNESEQNDSSQISIGQQI